MRLYRLFVKASWEQVRSIYLTAYPGEKSSLPDNRRVYSHLLGMPVEASDTVLTYVPEIGEDGMTSFVVDA